MNGMSLDEFKYVVEFVQKHHKFGYVKDIDRVKVKGKDHLMMIKYVDCTYDSRTHDIWSINFRGFGNDIRLATNHFTGINPAPKDFKYDNLFDWVMVFKGEWIDSNILKDCKIVKF